MRKRKIVKSKKVNTGVVKEALDKIGTALVEKGISLNELIERGRELRGVLIEKEGSDAKGVFLPCSENSGEKQRRRSG